MIDGIVVSSDLPIVSALLERYVCEGPNDIKHIVYEMITPLLLRLGVPLDLFSDTIQNNTPLPIETYTSIYSNLNSGTLFKQAANILNYYTHDDRLLLRATINFGIPRILAVDEDYFLAYRKLNFATLFAHRNGSDFSYNLRFMGPDLQYSIYTAKDDLLESIYNIIDRHQLLEIKPKQVPDANVSSQP